MKMVAIYRLGRDCDNETTYLLFFSTLWLMFLKTTLSRAAGRADSRSSDRYVRMWYCRSAICGRHFYFFLKMTRQLCPCVATDKVALVGDPEAPRAAAHHPTHAASGGRRRRRQPFGRRRRPAAEPKPALLVPPPSSLFPPASLLSAFNLARRRSTADRRARSSTLLTG